MRLEYIKGLQLNIDTKGMYAILVAYLLDLTQDLIDQATSKENELHISSNPHYGIGKGATIYRFVSDQFSSFYTKVINTNARDAVHVIDGILYRESDLMIEEHYTDTAGQIKYLV